MWRSGLAFDTQEVEGMNNILQEMSKRAGFLHLALASARMSIKKGDTIEASACAAFHKETMTEMSSYRQAHRFIGTVACGPAPAEAIF